MGATAELANVVAIDRQTLSKPFVTTMSLAIDGTGKDPELNKYLSKAIKELAGAWTIQKSEQITLTNRKFALVRATALQAKTPVTLFAYLTPHQGEFCLLLFTVASADADRQAGDFQKIAASLQSEN
jgi:NAD(P)H-hydrate repair Nnr-like enzyme with NAD(P)H-hydrate dehydratase domain